MSGGMGGETACEATEMVEGLGEGSADVREEGEGECGLGILKGWKRVGNVNRSFKHRQHPPSTIGPLFWPFIFLRIPLPPRKKSSGLGKNNVRVRQSSILSPFIAEVLLHPSFPFVHAYRILIRPSLRP